MSGWWDDAACQSANPEVFFAFGDPSAALAWCAVCPVVAACREWALDTRLADGVAGGLTEDERRKILRRRQPAQRRRS